MVFLWFSYDLPVKNASAVLVIFFSASLLPVASGCTGSTGNSSLGSMGTSCQAGGMRMEEHLQKGGKAMDSTRKADVFVSVQ